MNALAPELSVSRWLNLAGAPPPSLSGLRGKVVVLHAFQMLCPGCVSHGIPQAQKLHRLLAGRGDVVVIGLHTVFEHHAAMTEVALEAFIHEYRLTMPIGIDRPAARGPIPETMGRYDMRGTPTTIVIDRDGVIREHAFGQADDLSLGVMVGALAATPPRAFATEPAVSEDCAGGACAAPASPPG
ncbi:peroxiredoxin [Bosea sp. (in: a-proteobacteria)]|uniref:peroxiredoxin family protein n=1 Tax=Bosea sp. (in: a-proteobacteria) TaxID=1871050 RepID=UPI00261D1887|nr:TlpA disulfide reductase family protein [Bosea sp. (in: a-proteobacteria)]MCO5091374.1 TlpA family protein disulfide reductase [Bosea sp. (in: a-proteobacteria)]